MKMSAYSGNRRGFLDRMAVRSELEQVDERHGGRVMGYLYPGATGIFRRCYRIVHHSAAL